MNKETIVITGGSKGIGKASAKCFLENGYQVVLVARGLSSLEVTKQEFVDLGFASEDILIHAMDVGDVKEISSFKELLHRWGIENLRGLVLNAALQILRKPNEWTEDDVLSQLKINVVSPVMMIKTLYSLLQSNGKGTVTYVSSIMDRRIDEGFGVYGGSKAFMNCYVKHAALDMGKDGIVINVVTPGATNTEMMEDSKKQKEFDSEAFQKIIDTIGLKRLATPAEIGEAIYFAITGPRYFHGDEIRVHGGLF